MKYLSSLVAIALLGTAASAKAQSFQEQFQMLSPQEQAATRAEATQKEDYDQMPKVSSLNAQSVVEFCKLLPRGLETLAPEKFVSQPGVETQRTYLWAQYVSCKDSLLYYEGHRFFKSDHYTGSEISSAIAEIEKVMAWLVDQEKQLDSKQRYSKAY